MKKIFISSGEHSGDLISSLVVAELQQMNSDYFFDGIGGQNLENKGVKLIENTVKYSSIGLVETLINIIPLFIKIKKIKSYLCKTKIDLFIAVDCRILNQILLNYCIDQKIPFIYLCTPTKWWLYEQHQKSLNIISKAKRIYPAFKKEADYYQKHRIPSLFKGHPLKEHLLKTTKPHLKKDKKLIALFPGSRKQEVKELFPIFLDFIEMMEKNNKNLTFFIAAATPLLHDYMKELIKKNNNKSDFKNLHFWEEHSVHLIQKSYFSIACSGSIAIEHCILQTPAIITYKVNKLSYFLAKKRLKKEKYISWPNILSQKKILPEFIQDQAHAKNLYQHAIFWLENKEAYQNCCHELNLLQHHFGEKESLQEIAKDLIKYV